VTTTYFVELNDHGFILEDQITVPLLTCLRSHLERHCRCEGEQAFLDAGPGFETYLWSTGSTNQSIIVAEPGEYWVEVANDFGCTDRDTAVFSLYPLPPFHSAPIRISAKDLRHAGCRYRLQHLSLSTGDNSYYINVTQAGEYWVLISDEHGCQDSDTIVLTMDRCLNQ